MSHMQGFPSEDTPVLTIYKGHPCRFASPQGTEVLETLIITRGTTHSHFKGINIMHLPFNHIYDLNNRFRLNIKHRHR